MSTDFLNSFTGRLSGKFATNTYTYLNIPPHINYVATLPCEISMFKKSLCSRSKWSKLPCKTQPLKNVKYLLFNSVTKRRSHQPYKLPLSTVHNCCNKEKDVAAKCRTSVVGQSLMASVCQSLSQTWSTAVWYLLITAHINLSLNVTTISNGFCPLHTSYFTWLASSASLRTNV